jgi:CheY-like chemotaxis protein
MIPSLAGKSAYRILLVEDNDDHAELILRSLGERSARLELDRVSDGEAALTHLGLVAGQTAPGSLPDLILLDLRLPKVDGMKVLETIKSSERLHCIPVVVLSSSQSDSDIASAYRTHANSYVVKSPDFEKLNRSLAGIGSYWMDVNQALGA